MLTPAEKIFFWSGIMRDHAEFMIINLSSREPEFIRVAQNYKDQFISIRNEVRSLAGHSEPQAAAMLAARVIPVLTGFIEFKRLIVRRLLECNIEIGLPPTFINHMINEALEFGEDLCKIQADFKPDPVRELIQLHKVWLPDASGHAANIASDLDPTEMQLIKKAKEFKKKFDDLFIKAVELGQMLERACLDDGALTWLNEEAKEKISDFICYLDKIRSLRLECKAMGVIKPLVPDHMIREEKYYLLNIQKYESAR